MKAHAPPPPPAPQPAPRHIFRTTTPDVGGTSGMEAKENILRATVDLQLTLPQGNQIYVTEDGRWEKIGPHKHISNIVLICSFYCHMCHDQKFCPLISYYLTIKSSYICSYFIIYIWKYKSNLTLVYC